MTVTSEAKVESRRPARDWAIMWERYGISVVLVVFWILAAITTPRFLTIDNLDNVLRQSSFVGVAAVGMTIAIIAGTFDLSVGSNLALSATVAVWAAAHYGVAAAIFAGLATGTLVGAINGLLVSRVRIPAFIATLGMMFVLAGFALVLTGGNAYRFNGPSFIWMGNGNIGPLPTPFVLLILCALIGAGILRLTTFGRYVYAVGSNSVAAIMAGVPIQGLMLAVFMVVGLFTGVAAVLLGSRLYSAGPGLEPGFELRVIATVVLGGSRLAGGRGGMLGTVAAAILFATLANVLNLNHADAFWQRVVEGLVLLLALSIEGIRQRIEERMSRTQ